PSRCSRPATVALLAAVPGGGALQYQIIHIRTWPPPRLSHKAPTLTIRSSHKAVSAATTPSAPSLAHKVLILTPQSFHKTISTAATSSVHRLSHKAATIAAALSVPQLSRKATTVAAASSAPWLSDKVATLTPRSSHKTISTVVASSALWPSHKAATPTPWSSHKTVSATVAASSASGRVKRRSRKASPVSWRTTRINRQDASHLPPGHRYDASHSESRHSRRAPTIALKKKVMVIMKRGDLPRTMVVPATPTQHLPSTCY
ncbi:hypothetical protein ACLOJK_039180, partial [Asimina triloba]